MTEKPHPSEYRSYREIVYLTMDSSLGEMNKLGLLKDASFEEARALLQTMDRAINRALFNVCLNNTTPSERHSLYPELSYSLAEGKVPDPFVRFFEAQGIPLPNNITNSLDDEIIERISDTITQQLCLKSEILVKSIDQVSTDFALHAINFFELESRADKDSTGPFEVKGRILGFARAQIRYFIDARNIMN